MAASLAAGCQWVEMKGLGRLFSDFSVYFIMIEREDWRG